MIIEFYFEQFGIPYYCTPAFILVFKVLNKSRSPLKTTSALTYELYLPTESVRCWHFYYTFSIKQVNDTSFILLWKTYYLKKII